MIEKPIQGRELNSYLLYCNKAIVINILFRNYKNNLFKIN